MVFEDKQTKHKQFCEILERRFPQLKEVGWFTLHRAKAGGQDRELYPIKVSWYDIPAIRKEVKGSACIYIRPIQRNLSLARKYVVRILLLYF